AKPKVRVSTKSVPVAKPASQKPAATGARYVQVGLFGDPANASATVARMQALGLPVRQGTVRSKGRVLQTIMVGPVAPDSAPRVLANIRKAGYGDAYLR
ncbi:MAG: SPOR domain-containing protein, partial [Pseudomonadota bacterium]|nr:SPOR domain-containing protein [Pseudomonadota bacterium]